MQPYYSNPVFRTPRKNADIKPHMFPEFFQKLYKQGWKNLIYVSDNHHQGKERLVLIPGKRKERVVDSEI